MDRRYHARGWPRLGFRRAQSELLGIERDGYIEARPEGEFPIGQLRRIERQRKHAAKGERPHEVAERRGRAAQKDGHDGRQHQQHGRFDKGISEDREHVSGPPSARQR